MTQAQQIITVWEEWLQQTEPRAGGTSYWLLFTSHLPTHWDLGQQRSPGQTPAGDADCVEEIFTPFYPAEQIVVVPNGLCKLSLCCCTDSLAARKNPGQIYNSSVAIEELSLRWAALCGLTAQSLGSNWAEYTGTNWFIWKNMGCQQQK